MALELNKLTQNVQALSQHASQRLQQLSQRLPAARGELARLGVADEAVHRKIQAAIRLRWAGAIPTQEAVDGRYPAPGLPERINVVAADGSQIYPDRHGISLYYLINIGSIVFRHGLSQAPTIRTDPEVFFEDADLYEPEGGQKPVIQIDAERDRRELGTLARWAEVEARMAPTVALLDNGLMLYLSLQSNNQRLVDELLDQYVAHLGELQRTGAAVAGVVDRPRAASVIRLLRLAQLAPEAITETNLRDLGEYEHLTDAMVFDFLEPGQRSALFENASPQNQDHYKPLGHAISFFYLNTGSAGQPNILRVEVPEWVARDPERLGWVHASLLEQCRITAGFPYVLMRAHELAVVTMQERREFDQMVLGALLRQGLTPSISQKAQGKAWTGGPKGRYPR